MILHAPEIVVEKGEVMLRAAVEAASRKACLPAYLWHAFSGVAPGDVRASGDASMAALVLLAMALKEDLEVRAPVSPRLKYRLEEYQGAFACWFPGLFHRIRVFAPAAEAGSGASWRAGGGVGVGMAFSGGADSFYTLWRHLAVNCPERAFQVTHLLFAHGFDIPLEREKSYAEAANAYEGLAGRLGLKLIRCRTNVREFLEPLSWERTHGAALISAALALEGLLGRFLVPSSATYRDARPWGSDPRADPLLSTETLEVMHDAGSVTRVEKLEALSGWDETHGLLRVCWEKADGLRNCGRCGKCVATMAGLEMAGALPRYSVFPARLRLRTVRRLRWAADELLEAKDFEDRAWQLGRKQLARALRWAFWRSRIWLAMEAVASRAASAVRWRWRRVRNAIRWRRGLFSGKPSGGRNLAAGGEPMRRGPFG